MSLLPDQIKQALSNNLVFHGLTEEQYREITPFFKQTTFPANTVFIEQDTRERNLFIIIKGRVSVMRSDADNTLHRIGTLSNNDTIGELAFVDKSLRSASVKTEEDTTLITLDIPKFCEFFKQSPVLNLIYKNLANHFSSRLRHTNETVVMSLRENLKQAQKQASLGRLTVTTLIILAVFVFSLNAIQAISHKMAYTTILTLPLLVLTFIAIALNIKLSSYPLQFYGITLKNYKPAIITAVLYTIPVLAFITFLKWYTIKAIPALHNEPLFNLSSSLITNSTTQTVILVLIASAYILISSPIQELIFRGVLQSSLEEFLVSKYNVLLAVLVTNLIFAMMHLAISFVLAASSFFVGLFWSFLYRKHRSLVGVTLSHLIIGFWVFFILGIKNVLAQLM
ncbi:MAG: hypothetical protein COZ46_04205 [Verrucomicrobia bacterium CG_4_10_14_3_um_filter_43_23]|nr:MAG: hypothetical protein AUJ82_07550 [Verrucomicrobia bacterium CG1_02_43_26]PIP58629.1 MAG: hypothetical protein COX01_07775 [Verrucomicrobia bacterium CG22_combo_CG10-13_8_21_14_all_43_17]PIX58385.1 MAG: hypothetical protein COZ46_04205 [Verrucomicrobia bacterium CG_4_10_14_3_um_filter_43_23]PIY61223.1 MAG: hypothetical protein COY94_06425 [Verrucomicrobia bacterium CG_4_10_14_0_8_um_filter_43_34]PJA44962.1 MAG: hypothetical protein CO175_00130 [Verrucomicrobia bacterium CG_4_9_14_3_um_fi